MKKVIIIGAGPAGLTAAYELLRQSGDFEVVILEGGDDVGGISRTIRWHENRMDIGGHGLVAANNAHSRSAFYR